MSELCLSKITKTHFSSLLLSDFMLFCSFILSHPLYFSYFIFFSPYLLKLLSFLSPLFITTFLLLLALLTLSPGLVNENSLPDSPDSKVGFLLTAYHVVVQKLRTKQDYGSEEFLEFEELEAYKIVFDTTMFEARENPVEALELKLEDDGMQGFEAPLVKGSSHGDFGTNVSETVTSNLKEDPVEFTQRRVMGDERLKDFLLVGESENLTCKVVEEKEAKPLLAESDKVEEFKEERVMRRGSKVLGSKISETIAKFNADCGGEYTSKVKELTRKFDANFASNENGGEDNSKVLGHSQAVSSNLGSFGSMRKEKEWKRTLACKLFEERNNVEGGEGMDLLWETYEMDSNKAQAKSNKKKGKKGGVEYYEDDEEEEDMDGQLCCLQALKFSAGKMNLGMGRPNLLRISKALKGIGWLHHVSRHGKKG